MNLHMQANHLGPFLLTRLLEQHLVRSNGRVVNVSSVMHRLVSVTDARAWPQLFLTDPEHGVLP